MGDLAAIMARRRQMEDDAGEEGMYAPPSGGPRAAAAPQPRSAPRSAGRGPASAQRPLPSGQNGAVPAAPPSFLDLQEDEESEEEYDEGDDMAAQIAAYQQQLKAAGAPGSVAAPSPGPSQPSSFLPPQSNGSMAHNAAPASGYGGAPASGYGGAPASGYGGGNQGEQLFDNDVTEVGEVNLEADEGAEIAAYQLQLRSQDEADAVTGLACGNLQDVIASRGAPKSNSYSQPSSAGTGMGPSSYLSLSPDSQMPGTHKSVLGGGGWDNQFSVDGPTECTCDEDMAELCPYCTMINGPASNTTTASSLQQPDSSAAPSMPNSYSSYAGMPSQRHGSASLNQSREIPPGSMSPGWSEQHQQQQAAAAPPLAGGAGTAHTSGVDVDGGKGGARQAGVKKKGGGFLCCFRPAVDEDEDVAPPHGATGGINGSRGIEGPSTNRTSGGTSGTNGDRVNSGKWSDGTADDLVQDGVPLGGITSTSEDVIQLDHGTMLQCNVGLSIGDEHSQPEYAQPYPTHSAYDSPPSNGTIQSPQSDATIMGMPESNGTIMAPDSNMSFSPGPTSWTPPSQLAANAGANAGNSGNNNTGATVINTGAMPPPSMPRSRRPAPSSGTSLFSVNENTAQVGVAQPPTGGVVPGKGNKAMAPVSASLQELQGLDDRRNMYLQSLQNKAPANRQAAPVSNTLLELQQRQAVGTRLQNLQG